MNSITHRSALPASHQHGLSLVELMVALLIALILTGGVIQIFVSSSQTYRQQEALSRLQENTRFAIDTLQRELFEAGHYGCVSNMELEEAPFTNPRLSREERGLIRVTLNNPNAWQWNFNRPVEGFRGTGSGFNPTLPIALAGVLDDSDVLTIRSVTGAPLAVLDHPLGLPPGAEPLEIAPNNALAQGDIVLVNNCSVAAVFQVTNANPDASGRLEHETGAGPLPGNYTQTLGTSFTPNGEVMRVSIRSYYIANGASGRPALFRSIDAQAAGVELVEGVERMRVAFGVDDSNPRNFSADRFLTPQQVDNQGLWESVVAVRVTLLMASTQQGVIDQPQQINFDGEVFTPDDRRLRLVVNTTVGLRNRLP